MTMASDFALRMGMLAAIGYAIIWLGPLWLKSLYLIFDIFSYFPIMYILAPLSALEGTLIFFWMYPEELPKRFGYLLNQV